MEGKQCQVCRTSRATTTVKDTRGRKRVVCTPCSEKRSPELLRSRRVVANTTLIATPKPDCYGECEECTKQTCEE